MLEAGGEGASPQGHVVSADPAIVLVHPLRH